jgi:H+/Cl- antiporter ClcA
VRKQITESTVLFISIIKWVFLATIAGAIVGGATALFLKLLAWATGVGQQSPYTFLLLPVALFLSALSIKYLAPDAEGHGTEKVIEAIHKRSGKIGIMVVPVKLLATIITLAIGGSVGKEGPCAQIGAGLTSFFSDILKFDDHDRKKLVICGISAGFAAVFGTPIAGSIFGVEVLFVGAIMYEVLLPSFIAGITAYEVSSSLGITYFHGSINVIPVFSELFLLKVMVAGLFFGICSIILIEMLKAGDRISERIKIWKPFKGLIGGILLVGLTYMFSAKYLGLGLPTIEAAFRGEATDWYAFLVKPLFTAVTLSFGGSGGIVTPIFFIGATAGLFFAYVFSLNAGTFAAIGLASVLAGAANTPIAASIMAVELFGPQIAPYATVACVISFLITGHRSVYPSQVLSISKSPSLKVELGKELENIQSSYLPRKKSLASLIINFIDRIERLVRRIQESASSSDHSNDKDVHDDRKS